MTTKGSIALRKDGAKALASLSGGRFVIEPPSSGYFVCTARQEQIPYNFFLSLSRPPARLLYFTKKRFIEALTLAGSGGLKRNRPYLQGNFGGAPLPEFASAGAADTPDGRRALVNKRSRNIFNGFLRAHLMRKFQHLVLFNGRSRSMETHFISMI